MIERFEAGPRMSQVVTYPASGKIVVLAGQVASDTSLDVAGQTADVLAKTDRLLALAGADKSQLISATIWLRDIAEFNQMNAVWDKWVMAGQAPARACIEARMATPEIRVEIQVTARVA